MWRGWWSLSVLKTGMTMNRVAIFYN